MRNPIDHRQALIYVMVMVSAADSDMTDGELRTIGEVVRTLPIFDGFEHEALVRVAEQCAEILSAENGLETALTLIQQVLPERLRETAYALACDIAVSDGHLEQEELRLLELLRESLAIERLRAAAIEYGAASRFVRP